MKYYVTYPFGITSILKNKLNKLDLTQTSNLNKADFIYLRISQSNKNQLINKKSTYKYAKYVNNFIDTNNKLCITGDYCLANKYIFSILSHKILGDKPYIPKTYPFDKHNINYLKKLDFNKNKYILKPENDYSRGGITLIYNYNNIIEWLSNNPKYNRWVLQKYIINPLLIYGKKFHFRTYILMIKRPNQKSNYLELYQFDRYFALGSSLDYHPNSKNLEGHLTGAKYCNVHLVTPKLLQDNHILFQKIKSQFIDIAIDCGKIAQKTLRQLYPYQTNYHLFALDIICDQNYQTHLLEINNGGIGTEMNDLEPYMCPNGGKLHDTNTITTLFENIIDIVLDKDKNKTEFIDLSKYLNTPIIESFSHSNSNYNIYFIIISICLIIYIIFIIYKKTYKK